MKILIADDSRTSLHILEALLKGAGHELSLAGNGAEALKAARKNPPDLIVTDILMPVMDGFVLCRKWMADNRLKKIPFVFYTATYTDPRDEEFALGLGAERFILKPQQPEELVNILNQVIAEHGKKVPAAATKSLADESEVGRQYDSVLSRKLEKKIAELQKEGEERRLAEEKAEHQHSLLKAIIESAEDSIFSVDREYRYTSFNSTHSKVMKELYGADIKLGKSLLDYMTVKEDQTIAKANIDRALAGEHLVEEAFMGDETKKRSYFTVSHDPIIDKGKGVVGVAVRAADATARKNLGQQVERERDIAQRYLDIASVIIVVLSGNGTVKMINEYGADLLGYPVEKIVGKNWFDHFVPAAERGAVKQVFIKIMKGELAGVDSYENEVVAKDGSLHLVSWRNRYITGEGGEIVQTLSSGMDITKRKEAEEEQAKAYDQLKLTLEGTVNALSSVAEHRDPYTSGHQERVTKLACAIAEEMGISPEICEDIRIAGRLHDIGKIEVPAEILSKPGRLTDMEFSMIKIHSTVGYDILKEAEFPCEVAKIVLGHHERMDGSGYPQGLKADDIFIGAKIMAVADVVEAMSSHRPYRSSLGIDAALEEIEKNRDKLYDPDVVDTCTKLFREKAFKF